MMYVLVWMQLFSTQSVEHYQLGTHATLEECQIELSKAAKMITHKYEAIDEFGYVTVTFKVEETENDVCFDMDATV